MEHKKAIAIFRIAVLTAILIYSLAVAMNGSIAAAVIAVVSGAFLIYFMVQDRKLLR
ncbi:hypothetical protein [Corynebacterium camporealensis]